MLINPRDEYIYQKGIEKGKKDVAIKLLEKECPLQEIIEITGLTKEQIQINSKLDI